MLVGGNYLLIVARLLGIRRPAPPMGYRLVWRHACATALSCEIVLFLTVWQQVPHGYWVVVTLCVVLHPVPGETTGAAQDRIIGTAVGAIAAIPLAVLLPVWASLLAALGCAIIIASWPARNGSWFSFWVLVKAEVGTDLSRTYMSTEACRAAREPALLIMMFL